MVLFYNKNSALQIIWVFEVVMTATTFPVEIDLPGVEIKGVQINREGSYEIRVSSTITGCPCRQCGQLITKLHGHDREIRLKHLPIFGRETYILIR